MFRLHQYYNPIYSDMNKQQIIEILIPGAGKTVSSEIDTLVDMEDILGIVLVNPVPKISGHGTLRIRIGDTEILPVDFHADLISTFNDYQIDTTQRFACKEYIFPVKAKAKGNPLKINYTEPVDGNSGRLYLYLLGKKTCSYLTIPEFRFQVLEIPVPKGNNTKDIEIPVEAKTLQSHCKVAGCLFLGPTNRIKEVKLSIDDTTVFPAGMSAQLATKEIVNSRSIGHGIFTRHTIPMCHIIRPCDLTAKNSKIEGNVLVTPAPDKEYSIYLYLLTIA